METDPSRVDMEILDGTEDAYIEMARSASCHAFNSYTNILTLQDLGLGVFERGGSKQSGGKLTVMENPPI